MAVFTKNHAMKQERESAVYPKYDVLHTDHQLEKRILQQHPFYEWKWPDPCANKDQVEYQLLIKEDVTSKFYHIFLFG